MTWLKLDDKIRSHPKVLKAGPDACWLWVCCLSYASDHLTDGMVPAEALPTLGPFRHVERLAARLVEVGLLDVADGGYRVHDYLMWNPSAAEVRAKRSAESAQKAAAGRVGGLRSAEARRQQRAASESEAEIKHDADTGAVVSATEVEADHEADHEADSEQTSSTLPKHTSSPVRIPSGSRPPDPPVASLRSATSPRSRGSPGDGGSPGFAQFWREYPRRVGRRKAFLAWQRLDLDAQAETVLAGLARVRPAWTDPAFIPHPTTWLNRAGWEDEPEPPRPTTVARDRPTASEAVAWISQHLGRDGEDMIRRHRDWLARPWPVWETARELSDQGVQMGLFALLMDREATGDAARELAARYVQPR